MVFPFDFVYVCNQCCCYYDNAKACFTVNTRTILARVNLFTCSLKEPSLNYLICSVTDSAGVQLPVALPALGALVVVRPPVGDDLLVGEDGAGAPPADPAGVQGFPDSLQALLGRLLVKGAHGGAVALGVAIPMMEKSVQLDRLAFKSH